MKQLYAFYDRVAGVYSAPFLGESQEALIRGIKLALKQGGKEPWQVFPEDNELYCLGNFDEITGQIDNPNYNAKFITSLKSILTGEPEVKKNEVSDCLQF